LLKRINPAIAKLQQLGISTTADLVYTSGSSLDPHISPEAAKAQITRIAQARKVEPSQIEKLIDQNSDRRFLGVFGEDGVNVLKLNLAIDAISKA